MKVLRSAAGRDDGAIRRRTAAQVQLFGLLACAGNGDAVPWAIVVFTAASLGSLNWCRTDYAQVLLYRANVRGPHTTVTIVATKVMIKPVTRGSK